MTYFGSSQYMSMQSYAVGRGTPIILSCW